MYALVAGTSTAYYSLRGKGPGLEVAGFTFHISVERMTAILSAIYRLVIGQLPTVDVCDFLTRHSGSLPAGDTSLLRLREVIRRFGNVD